MHPNYPYPHQQKYNQPLQSRGFNPPPQPARPPPQAPYQPPVQPPVSGYVQPYQTYPQYQPQPPAQYHQQTHHPSLQQRYPQPSGAHPAPHNHGQGYYTSTPSSYAPSPPYSRSPVVPPVRANSRSPEKRPLPAPTSVGSRQSPTTTSQPLAGSYVTAARSYNIPYASQGAYRHGSPASSSVSDLSGSQPLSRSPFRAQTHFSPHPQPHPQAYHTSSAQAPSTPLHSTRSSVDGGIFTKPALVPEVTSKRPLPAPPEGKTSLPVALGWPGVPGAVSLAQHRTSPHLPTQPPNTEAGRSAGFNAIRPPQRSSTLPNPTPKTQIISTLPVRSRDDAVQAGIPHYDAPPVHAELSTPNTSSVEFVPSPSVQRATPAFALPPRRKSTQSLAFRIASLSIQEEHSQSRPPNHSILPTTPTSTPPSGKNTLLSSSRFSAQTTVDLDDAPPVSSIRRSSFESKPPPNTPPRQRSPYSASNTHVTSDDGNENENSGASSPRLGNPSTHVIVPSINISESPPDITFKPPLINVSDTSSGEPTISVSEFDEEVKGPSIMVSEATPKITVSQLPEMPGLSQSSGIPDIIVADLEGTLDTSVDAPAQKRKGLICYGCGKGIIGRIVSAMGGRWHPACFKCTVCGELLEHVSSYEHTAKPYCHLDYHEKFAPQCYHCRTPIIDERFITLDDPALGKRVYHEQHFFCAECGDPFLTPTIKNRDTDMPEVVAQDDDVGFTVYNGHPYCEACHIRLRYPKCKRCKKSIRDGMKAVEALGGKWCWECFTCAGCEKPFDSPAFFQRENKPYCEACFSIIIKSEL